MIKADIKIINPNNIFERKLISESSAPTLLRGFLELIFDLVSFPV